MIRATAAARQRAPRAATLARAVLALLLAASVGALFYAQALKREDPLVIGHGGRTTFRPGGPGARHAHFHLRLSVGGAVDVEVVLPASDREVATLARDRPVREYRKFELIWDGTTSHGAPAPPGRYQVEVRIVASGRTVIVPGLQLVLEGRSP